MLNGVSAEEEKLAELLTTKEIALYLRLRPETMLRKVKRGEVPAIKVGGRFRFDKKEIDEWLRDNSVPRKSTLVIDDQQSSGELFREPLQDDIYRVLTVQAAAR